MVRAIVGANWGDEGKGKITDMLAKESDIIIRFQGGSNAGHTIINEYGKFALHLLPSGVFYQHHRKRSSIKYSVSDQGNPVPCRPGSAEAPYPGFRPCTDPDALPCAV